MGPIRRGLIAGALLVPNAAMAEVCDEYAPGWDGTPVTTLDGLGAHAQSPVVLVLLLGTAIAIRLRHQWGGLAAVVGWSAYIFFLMQNEVFATAVTEGCAGNPSLFIGIVTALSAGVVLYTAPIRKEPEP